MADYDKFNPDVPDVAPGNYNVTRPIDQPKANTALGGLFDSVGKGLKDAGEIVKDATKLTDFTNKEFLSNSISLDLNAQRDRHIVDLEEKNISLQGGQNADGSPPIGLQGLPGKVNTLAAAKAQNKVDDVYFRGRVDDLSKQYRAAYPGYRDYIDATFSKAGFGQPANAYMSALEQANQGLQAALGQGKSKTLDMLYKDGDKIKDASTLIDDLNSGRKTDSQVNAIIFPQLKTRADIEMRQHQFSVDTADSKNRTEQATKLVTDNITQDMATYMKLPEYTSIINRMDQWSQNPNSINEAQAQADAITLSHALIRLQTNAQRRDSEEHTFKTIDADGNMLETPQKYRNNSELGPAYSDVAGKAFQPLKDVINQLQNKDFGFAAATANQIKASHDEYAKQLWSGKNGGFWEASNFLQQIGPAWFKDFAAIQLKDSAGTSFNSAIKAMTQGVTWPTLAPNPPPATKQLEKLQEAGVNDPKVNKAVLAVPTQVLPNPKAPEEVKKNVIKSYFGSTNPSITDAMEMKDKVKTYSAMTSKPMVENIAKLPDVNKGQYFNWVTTEFSKNLSAEIGQLPSYTERGPTASTPYRIHWNDQTHQFGIDVKGNSNLQDVDNLNKIDWHYVHGGPPGYGNSGEIKNIVGAIKRINVGLTGLKNMADASGMDPNAYLIHQLQNSGLTDNKFWDAVKIQATAMQKDQEKPKTE